MRNKKTEHLKIHLHLCSNYFSTFCKNQQIYFSGSHIYIMSKETLSPTRSSSQTLLRRTDTKQLYPATQPTQYLTMTCKGCTARVARQDCVAKLLRVCPPLRSFTSLVKLLFSSTIFSKFL